MTFSLSTLLTAIFVTLKITSYVDWSWFWVLSPTIFALGLTVLLTAGVFLVFLKEKAETR